MAYGVKYRLTFADEKAVTWIAEISKDGYSGSVSDMECSANPVTISWVGDGLFDPLRASKCTIRANSQTDFAFSEFYNAGEFDFICKITKNGSVFWQGVYVPETLEEPYVSPPYFIKLRFSDLKALKYIRFDNSGVVYDEHKLLLSIVKTCLDNLPFACEYTEIINVLENNITELSNTWLLNTVYLDRYFFAKINSDTGEVEGDWCWNVLKTIFHALGCSLFQFNNRWYITQIENYENATAEAVNYLTTGVIDTTEAALDIRDDITNDSAGITWLEQSGVMKFTEVYDELVYRYLYKSPNVLVDSLILDNEFDLRAGQNTAALRFGYWKLNGPTPGTDIDIVVVFNYHNTTWQNSMIMYASWLDSPIYWLISFMGSQPTYTTELIAARERLNSTNNRAYLDLWVHTDDSWSLILDCNFTLKLTAGQTTSYTHNGIHYNDHAVVVDWIWDVLVKLHGTGNTYYLRVDSNGELEWTTVADSYFRIYESTVIGERINWSQQLVGGLQQVTYIFPKYLKFALPTIPVIGLYDVSFSIRAPAASPTDTTQPGASTREWRIGDFEIHRMDVDFNPKGKQYSTTYTESATFAGLRKREKKIDVLLGDPEHAQFRGGFKVLNGSDYEPTNAWYHRGDSGNTKAHSKQFILDPYAKMYGNQRRGLSGTLYGDVSLFKSLKVPVAEGAKIYYIKSLTINCKDVSNEVEMEEVSDALPAYTVVVEERGLSKLTDIPGLNQTTPNNLEGYLMPDGNFPHPNNLPNNQVSKDMITLSNNNGLIVDVNSSNGGSGTGSGTTHGNFPGGQTGGGL